MRRLHHPSYLPSYSHKTLHRSCSECVLHISAGHTHRRVLAIQPRLNQPIPATLGGNIEEAWGFPALAILAFQRRLAVTTKKMGVPALTARVHLLVIRLAFNVGLSDRVHAWRTYVYISMKRFDETTLGAKILYIR